MSWLLLAVSKQHWTKRFLLSWRCLRYIRCLWLYDCILLEGLLSFFTQRKKIWLSFNLFVIINVERKTCPYLMRCPVFLLKKCIASPRSYEISVVIVTRFDISRMYFKITSLFNIHLYKYYSHYIIFIFQYFSEYKFIICFK